MRFHTLLAVKVRFKMTGGLMGIANSPAQNLKHDAVRYIMLEGLHDKATTHSASLETSSNPTIVRFITCSLMLLRVWSPSSLPSLMSGNTAAPAHHQGLWAHCKLLESQDLYSNWLLHLLIAQENPRFTYAPECLPAERLRFRRFVSYLAVKTLIRETHQTCKANCAAPGR